MSRRWRVPVAKTIAVIALVFSLTPTALVVVASLNGGTRLDFPPSHPSFGAYLALLSDPVAVQSILHSLYVGLFTVVVAVPIGTMTAFGLATMRGAGRAGVTALLQLGIVTPLVVSGVAYLVIFTVVGKVGDLTAMTFAIAVVNLPFVIAIVGAAIEKSDPTLAEAARTLGAEKVQTFLFVRLPEIGSSIVTSCLLLFVFGITEFLMSLILSTAASVTLPVYAFGSLRSGITPQLAAVGGLYVAITVAVVVVLSRTRVLTRLFTRSND
jgi:putative spermidine/putrescine transport system permease protein